MKKALSRYCVCLLLIPFFPGLGSYGAETGVKPPDDVGNFASRLTEKHFRTDSLKELSASGLQEAINANSSFKNMDEGAKVGSDGTADSQESVFSSGGSGSPDSCIAGRTSAVFERSGKASFKAILDNRELRGCFPPAMQYKSMIMSFVYDHMKVRDSAGNEVDIEGKRVNDVFAASSGYSLARFNLRSYMYMSISEQTHEKRLVAFDTTFFVAAGNASDFDAPCVVSRDGRVSECKIQIVAKLESTDGLESYDRTVLIVDDITANPADAYYTNGTVEFAINHWRGTMTYDSNGSTPPTYTAVNSKTKERASGTYYMDGIID